MITRLFFALTLALFTLLSAQVYGADGKILATSGITQFEGTGGGGIVPFATLASYATRDQYGFTAHRTALKLDDFDLRSFGFNINIRDRLELSYVDQRLDVNPLSLEIQQYVYGAKVKLLGDLIYTRWPQVSVGVQHKILSDDAILPEARDNHGTDYYIAASRLHIAALANYNVLWNLTLRSTQANQTGFLGFGGNNNSARDIEFEGALAVQLRRSLVIGAEYRTKPNNLAAVDEDDWKDIFVAWAPNKHVSFTAAYTDFGTIGGLDDQNGFYLSITGNL